MSTLNKHLGEVIERYLDAVKVNNRKKRNQNLKSSQLSETGSSREIYMQDIMQEYIDKNKSDYENFLDP